MITSRRLSLSLGALVSLALATPAALVAQASAGAMAGDTTAIAPLGVTSGATPGSGPEAFVMVGGLAPLARLSSDPGSFATQVSSAPMVGGTVGYWLPNGVGVGAQLLYAPANLNIIPTSFQGPIPTDLGDARYLAATVELRYRIPLRGPAGVLAPYVALGGGVRHLNFDPIANLDVTDTTDPVGTIAGGAEARLYGPVAMRLELRDYVSRFDATASGVSRVQHDVAITIGLGVLP
jgi:hypothetical protein